MNRHFALALVALALTALPARADGFGFNANVGLSFQCNWWGCNPCGPCGPGCGPCGPVQLGPWYQYWPMGAHFQTPAPITYPFWPAPQVAPPGAGPTLQPACYYPSAPAYWYGR